MMNSSVMQDSQDPYDTENSQQNSKAGPSLYSYKTRPEWKRQINKRRNKKDHEDWIEQMNITDPTMLVMPNEEVLIDENEEEYEGMPPLTEEDNEEEVEEIPTLDKVGLVARRALATQLSVKELQYENIFYTCCHIKNKVCSVVIDPGSCTNVASALMVEKLSLSTTNYPRSHKS